MNEDPTQLGTEAQTEQLPSPLDLEQPAATPAPPLDTTPEEPHPERSTPTRASGIWAAVVAGLVVLTLLIVFILENTAKVRITLFGAHWHLPLGIALLLAAIIGGFVVVFAGAARILELRRRAHTEQRRARSRRRAAAKPQPAQSQSPAH